MNTLGPVPQSTSAKYTATLVDETGTAVPAANLSTLILTVYTERKGAIVNSRSAQNVLNANGVTVDSSGNLVWTMTPADNALLEDALATELHYALFEATWAGGAKGVTHSVGIIVSNKLRRP